VEIVVMSIAATKTQKQRGVIMMAMRSLGGEDSVLAWSSCSAAEASGVHGRTWEGGLFAFGGEGASGVVWIVDATAFTAASVIFGSCKGF
jgi:hypothetical protein